MSMLPCWASQHPTSSPKRPRNRDCSRSLRRLFGMSRISDIYHCWMQMNSLREAGKPISFAQFWRVIQLRMLSCCHAGHVGLQKLQRGISLLLVAEVWHAEFSHLQFRQESSHSVCPVCVRHKLLVQELSGHLLARKEQLRRYTEHLKDQYMDRVAYWSSRGLSRLRNRTHVTCIIDSMDQAKMSLPRSGLTRAKDLSTMVKPRCHLTAVKMHGHFILAALSDHDMPKNSSVMIELLGHSLALLAKTVCLRNVHLTYSQITRFAK